MAEKNEQEKIDEISRALGFEDGEKTIFEIVESDDKKQKMLTLKSGSWSREEPWFGIDENQDLHTMVSIKSLNGLIEAYRNLARENFDLRLEKSILQHVPIDFGDVWTVCMDEIKNIALKNPEKQILSVNLNEIVDRVRKEHPNLFINLNDIINRSQE